MIRSLIGGAIARTRTMMSVLIVIMFAGVVSYSSIPIEMDPDVEVPMIWVMIPHEGISPEDSERLIVRPIEFELKRLEGIEELDAYASEGSATIVVEFDSNFDQDQALLDVREAVAEQDDLDVGIAEIVHVEPAVVVLPLVPAGVLPLIVGHYWQKVEKN